MNSKNLWTQFDEIQIPSNIKLIIKMIEELSKDIKDTTALVKELKNELQEKLRNETT